MLKSHRTVATFLIVGISFVFILAPAHSNYNILMEADFITHGAKFEAGDLDDLWFDKQINWDFIPNESLVAASPETSLHGLLITPQVVPITSLFSVLRC